MRSVLVAELVYLQFYDDVAFQNAVVKHEVGKEIIPVYQDSLLVGFEAEAMPHFQEEALQVVKNGLFQVAFRDQGTVVQSEKFQRNRRVNNVFGL